MGIKPLLLPLPLSSSLNAFRANIEKMRREEALKNRRLLEAAEAGTTTASDAKLPRCTIDKVAVAAGEIGFSVPFEFVAQDKFASFLFANRNAAARQSLDSLLFGRLH